MTDPLAAVLRAHWHHHPLADDEWRCDCGARYSAHPAEHAAAQVRAWLAAHDREVAAKVRTVVADQHPRCTDPCEMCAEMDDWLYALDEWIEGIDEQVDR